MPFEFRSTSLSGVTLITPRCFTDERGFFMEIYQRSAFAAAGITCDFVQVNHSRSRHNVLRGMHWQSAPVAQSKLVRIPRGAVYDVVIDLRPDSPTFMQWEGFDLSENNRAMLFVPTGCAHGFLVLSEIADAEYKVDAEYSPEHERGICWNDPDIGIEWPSTDPIVSEKDRRLPCWSMLKQPRPLTESATP